MVLTVSEGGKGFAVLIQDKTAKTFKTVIEKHVHEGSVVWTDGHKSYEWMDKCPHTHESVVHRRGEFSRLRESGVRVSTNAIEGLFSRMKRFLRGCQACPRRTEHFAAFMGEFLWRWPLVERERERERERGVQNGSIWHAGDSTSGTSFDLSVQVRFSKPKTVCVSNRLLSVSPCRCRFLKGKDWRRAAKGPPPSPLTLLRRKAGPRLHALGGGPASTSFDRELCGPEGVVLQQNNILQQVIQQVHHDSNLHGAINEQQEKIGQIVAEVKRRACKVENGIATRFHSH